MNINRSELNAFVAQNRESLAKLLLRPHQDEETGSVVQKVHKEVVDKWVLALGSSKHPFLPAKHRSLMYLYAELLSLFITRSVAQNPDWMLRYASAHHPEQSGHVVQAEVAEAIERLVNNGGRSTIVGKCYNYFTGKVEYMLEDGNHLPVDLTARPEMVIDDTRLPECVLMLTDPQARRDGRIKQIDA